MATIIQRGARFILVCSDEQRGLIKELFLTVMMNDKHGGLSTEEKHQLQMLDSLSSFNEKARGNLLAALDRLLE